VTTLADLVPGQQFLFVAEVTALDQVTGMSVTLWGPSSTEAATAQITPGGVMTGQLLAPATQTPVTIVTGFAPVGAGDVMQNADGETYVCRWSQISPDGTVTWSASPDHRVIYPAAGWTVIGHVTL